MSFVDLQRCVVRRACPSLLAIGVLAALPFAAIAAGYPSGIVRVVVPTSAGSPPDIVARIVATEMAKSESWRIVVENRAGAMQTIGTSEVMAQPPDGHTLLAMSVGLIATPSLLPRQSYRLDADLVPVIKLSQSYNALIVGGSLTVQSVSGLVARLKAEPDKLNASHGGFGTPAHLIGEVFRLRTATKFALVPYQNAPQRVADIMNGTTHFAFFNLPATVKLIEGGQIRALAVTAAHRLPTLVDVPTIAEVGFPELTVSGEDWVGFAARVGTESTIVDRINGAANAALSKPEVRAALANAGSEPAGGSPTQFQALVQSQLEYWRGIIQEAGIKLPQ